MTTEIAIKLIVAAVAIVLFYVNWPLRKKVIYNKPAQLTDELKGDLAHQVGRTIYDFEQKHNVDVHSFKMDIDKMRDGKCILKFTINKPTSSVNIRPLPGDPGYYA